MIEGINFNIDTTDEEFVKQHNKVLSKIEHLLVNEKFKGNPLLGLYRQSICSASGTLNLMLKLKSIVGKDITQAEWQSLQTKMTNYETLKQENKELRDKLEQLKAVLV